LADTGYIEGRNVTVEYRWAQSHNDRLPALAHCSPINTRALAVKAATKTIPIVFVVGSDPVQLGLVTSFNRPGANVTGIRALTNGLVSKQLELLHELVPQGAVIAMLVNPTNQNAEPDTKDAQTAAGALGVRLLVLNANDQSEIEVAFATLIQQRGGALLVGSDAFFYSARDQLIALAARHRVPAIYDRREFTAADGLMSYGPNILDSMRQSGVYTGRILNGDMPGDLPVQAPDKYRLVINLKTAKALSLAVPQSILVLADEVIE
jgi:putative tryptophan/tyrosine transport system substrate-binding protein